MDVFSSAFQQMLFMFLFIFQKDVIFCFSLDIRFENAG